VAKMKLYINTQEYTVNLQTILTQNLYKKVTPLLTRLETTNGAKKAYESMLQKRILDDPYLMGKINLLDGENAWENVKNDSKFQEVVGEIFMTARENILDLITIDEQTLPVLFELFKECIDKKLITSPELLEAINTPFNSEFWQEQDINGILEELRFFRHNVLARIKTS
jgi:hypothetical protein